MHYLAAGSVLLVVLIAVGGWYLAFRVHTLQDANRALERTQEANRELLEQLRANVATRVPSAELLAAIERRETELATRRALRDALVDHRLGNTSGFSPLLTGLAERKPEPVWLRHIALDAGGVRLELRGSALDPAAIPVYLQRFAEVEALADRRVDRLEITRPAGQVRHVDFHLRAERRP